LAHADGGIARIIADLPFFGGLPAERLRALAEVAVPTAADKGQTIFLEGGEARGFYVVLAGQVKISKLAPDGREQIIHLYGPGEPFAEVPVFAGGRFPANAQATRDSRLLFFPREALLDLLRREPGLALEWLAVLARKLRSFTIQIEGLTLRETPQRLAAYLLDQVEREAARSGPSPGGGESVAEIELDMTKGHLAALLGTAQETLSRVLRRMSEAGLIEVAGPRITLLDRQALEALASGEERL